MPWETPQAPTPAELAACVECGLCLPHCPTFRLSGLETASPRGRIVAMRAVATDFPLDDVFASMMAFCLQCRACEAVCPSLAPFGRMMEGARAEVAAQQPSRRVRLRHRILGRRIRSRRQLRLVTLAAYLGQRMAAPRWLPGAFGNGLRGLRRLSLKRRTVIGAPSEAIGPSRGTAALVAGCVMDPWFGDVHAAAVLALRHAGWNVVVPPSQTCCGALAAHDGAVADAGEMASVNVAAFTEADVVVADAAGCSAHLKDYADWAEGGAELAAKTRDVTELVAEAIENARLPRRSGDEPVALHEPCHLRHAQRIVDAPRTILVAGGYRPVPLDPDGLCCGAAGVYSLLQREASASLGRQKADLVAATGAATVASANPGCEMQLRSHLGPGFVVRHPVELYVEGVGLTG